VNRDEYKAKLIARN